jgi:uncharacterized membrane protein (DUF373 family)/hemoglobin-like flavoprotein
MRTFQEIRDNYRFSDLEAETLKGLLPIVEPHAPRLIRDFYNLFLQMPDAAKFLQDEAKHARLEALHRDWLLDLFKGPYDERYFQRLQRVGQAHVNIGISAHFVYVGMNFLRQQLGQIIESEVEPKLRGTAQAALAKILDLNLDLISRAYRDEEMRRVFLSFKLDNALMRFARRFTFGLNLLVLLGLMALSVGVLLVLAHDISMIFRGSREGGLAAALGSLLVLWLMIELLDAEIDRLQGGEFKFNLFVGVALVAFIRKVLVATLAHESLQTELLYLGGILILGVIFWLVTKAETKKG